MYFCVLFTFTECAGGRDPAWASGENKTLLDDVRKQSTVEWVASNGGRVEFSLFIFV